MNQATGHDDLPCGPASHPSGLDIMIALMTDKAAAFRPALPENWYTLDVVLSDDFPRL